MTVRALYFWNVTKGHLAPSWGEGLLGPRGMSRKVFWRPWSENYKKQLKALYNFNSVIIKHLSHWFLA